MSDPNVPMEKPTNVPNESVQGPHKGRLCSKEKPAPPVCDSPGKKVLDMEKAAAKASKLPPRNHAGQRTDNNDEVEQCLQRIGSAKRRAFVRVLDYGVTAEQGTRKTMEDQHIMLAEGIPFFGVYDGHGGTACAEYLRDNLHSLIMSHAEVKTNPEKAIKDCIIEADRTFLSETDDTSNESGCVCAVALVLEDKLVVGNVGDTEAVLCRSGKPILLTTKHNLKNPDEMERVRGVGGRIFQNRVGHPKFNPSVISLAVTRAIGDAGFKLEEFTDGKPSGIIAEPATMTIRLTSEDEFVVMGCDGLWDVMSYEKVTQFCSEQFLLKQNSQAIAEELVRAALDNGSTDNVTAMIVRLNRAANNPSHEFIPEAAVSTSSRNLSEYP